MKQRNWMILVLLGLSGLVKAQTAPSPAILTWKPLAPNAQVSMFKKQAWVPFKQTSEVKSAPVANFSVSTPMPDSYYQQCFGFFCKREWELQQKVHIPVKLRLGTYQVAQTQEGY